jgi:hypothetical protein
MVTVTFLKKSLNGDTNAESGFIGEMLLMAIAVVSFSVIAVFIFSNRGPTDSPKTL